MIGEASVPRWLDLDMDWVFSQFGDQRKKAIQAYRQFVLEGKGLPSPLDQIRHQLLLGNDAFVERYKHDKNPLRKVSKAHRCSIALSLDDYRRRSSNRNEAMARDDLNKKAGSDVGM